jgi:cyanophycinase-like exopeptidase
MHSFENGDPQAMVCLMEIQTGTSISEFAQKADGQPSVCFSPLDLMAPLTTPVKTRTVELPVLAFDTKVGKKETSSSSPARKDEEQLYWKAVDERIAEARKTMDGFKGSLIVIGGNGHTIVPDIAKMMGKNAVSLVPQAAMTPDLAGTIFARTLVKNGVPASNISIVVQESAADKSRAGATNANRDKSFTYTSQIPAGVKQIYFGGGDQDKLFLELPKAERDKARTVLINGGTIWGTSAGTSVMSVEMINGGDNHNVEHMEGFAFLPWAVLDQHVHEKGRETRDVKALYQIARLKMPVIGIDEDTQVRFYWDKNSLKGSVAGAGLARIFVKPAMLSALELPRSAVSGTLSSGDKPGEVANYYNLKAGDTFTLVKAGKPAK